MDKVKALTPRGTHTALEPALDKINQWYVGWSNYYRMTNYPSQLHKIEAHIRRRLRSKLVSQQKRKQHLYRNLVKRGSATKTSIKNGLFKQQTVVTLKRPSGDESLSQQLVY